MSPLMKAAFWYFSLWKFSVLRNTSLPITQRDYSVVGLYFPLVMLDSTRNLERLQGKPSSCLRLTMPPGIKWASSNPTVSSRSQNNSFFCIRPCLRPYVSKLSWVFLLEISGLDRSFSLTQIISMLNTFCLFSEAWRHSIMDFPDGKNLKMAFFSGLLCFPGLTKIRLSITHSPAVAAFINHTASQMF